MLCDLFYYFMFYDTDTQCTALKNEKGKKGFSFFGFPGFWFSGFSVFGFSGFGFSERVGCEAVHTVHI